MGAAGALAFGPAVGLIGEGEPFLAGLLAQPGQVPLLLLDRPKGRTGLVLQPAAGPLVDFRFEEGLEQGFALLGLGAQHLGEAALGQQDHLAELGRIQPHDSLHLPGDLAGAAGHGLLLRSQHPEQGGRRQLLGGAAPPQLGGGVGRGAFHPVAGATGGEVELHPWHRLGRGMVGAEALHAPLPRHFAIEGEAHRIEQEGLAGAGAAVDQEEALVAEGVEVDGHPFGIGAEGLDHQVVGLHRSLPRPAASRARRRRSSSALLAGRPC